MCETRSADRLNYLPRVLVSILSYNSAETLCQTLRSFQRQTYSNFHLQVADNNSSDQTREMVECDFPNVSLIRFTENSGYTGGNNLVLKQALSEGYDYVLLANHDIEVGENAVAQLIETALNNSDAGVVGGVEVRIVDKVERAAGVGSFSYWTMRHKFVVQANNQLTVQSAPFVHGALVLFTARALQLEVRFDENLFMYYDEADLGFELAARGLTAYVDPRVRFRHRDRTAQSIKNSGDSAAKATPREGYLMQRNRLYLARKHGAWYHKIFYHLYAAFFELPLKFCWRTLQGRSRFASACVRGHLDAIGGLMGRGRDF